MACSSIVAKRSKTFCALGQPSVGRVEQLPGYAPDLNPDEGIWNYLKRVEVAKICCHDLQELRMQVIRARERLRHKRTIIRACSRPCRYLG
jgi:transposase